MAYKSKHFIEACRLLERVPERTWFDIDSDEKKLAFQCRDRAALRIIRDCFPGMIWKKTWVKSCGWWQFLAEDFQGWEIKVYGCTEAAPACRAITEKRTVKVRTPLTFAEHEEEQEVVIGWDCGPPAETVEA